MSSEFSTALKERDDALTDLATAQNALEEADAENNRLRAENNRLRAELKNEGVAIALAEELRALG